MSPPRWLPYLAATVVLGWTSLGIAALVDGATVRAIFWFVIASVWGICTMLNWRNARANPVTTPPRWWPYVAVSVVVVFLVLGLVGVVRGAPTLNVALWFIVTAGLAVLVAVRWRTWQDSAQLGR